MNPQSIARSSSTLLVHAIDPAARSLAIGILAAGLLRIFRVKSPSTRLAVWTGVLYAALAMPLLALMMPPIPLPIPAGSFFEKAPATPAAVVATPKATSVDLATPQTPLSASGSSGFNAAIASTEEISRQASRSLAPRMRVSAARAQSNSALLVVRPASAKPVAVSSRIPSNAYLAAVQSVSWSAITAVVFGLVALLMIARVILGSILAHRLARSAQTIGDCNPIRLLVQQARIAGVGSAPRLAESDVISVPLTLGVFKPAILLPSCWRNWSEATLSAVIAHEMSHVARQDALKQRLALIHRAIFWFSPLSWWLNRALAEAAEEASDEAALLAGADRAFYAETLVAFFAALSENSGRVYWQGVSMAAPGQADRRVDRILSWKGAVSMRMKKSLITGLAVFGIPVVLLAAAARPSTRQSAVPAVPAAPGAPVFPGNITAAPEAPARSAAAPESAPAIPVAADPIPAFAQGAPVAPLPPQPAAAQEPESPVPPPSPVVSPDSPVPDSEAVAPDYSRKEQTRRLQQQIEQEVRAQAKLLKSDKQLQKDTSVEVLKNLTMQLDAIPQMIPKIEMQPFDFSFQLGPMTQIDVGHDGDRFVIVSGDSPIVMSGDSQDVEHATALRSKINGDFIWFQHDEKSYIIRDQATVSQAKALFKTEHDLEEKQQALGKQMRDLGDQMRAQGQKMRDVHVTVPDLSAQMEKLEAQMKQLSASGGTEQQVGELQRQLGDLMRQIGQTQSQAGDQQRQIGEQMRALGDQQRALGGQMRQIGDQERDASRQAHTQMDQLLNDAITKGTAQPE